MTASQPQRPRLQARSIIAFSSLIMVIFCVVIAYQASRAYEESITEAEAEAERLVQSLASHVELSFLTVDLTLRRATERHYFNNLFGNNIAKDLENNFSLWVQDTPQLSALYLTDGQGKIVLSATTEETTPLFDAQATVRRENFFQEAAEDTSQEQQVSLFTKTPGAQPVLIMSRQYHQINGEFGGVVFGVMDPNYFQRFFQSIETGRHSFMSMIHRNGQVLVPGSEDEAEVIAVSSQVLASDVDNGDITTDRLVFDSSVKVTASEELHILPVILAVVMDEADFLIGWSNDRRKDLGFLAMFAIFGSILSYFALTMIKQIRRVEESEAKAVMASQAKSEFLANMSHELRTPLNAIIGFSEMMDAGYFGQMNDKQKERVHDINLCGNHLLQLINDILEFSKGEAGRLELSEENFDVTHVITECTRIMGQRAKMKGVELEQKIASNLPELYGDKRKIRQLLLNLLSNAIKFTNEGGRVTTTLRQLDSGKLELAVEDTGIGMNEGDIPQALSVFGQVHRRSHPDGTGLGLPLCRMFAELHDGTLEMQSKPGVGTLVRITFPTGRVRAEAKEQTELAFA